MAKTIGISKTTLEKAGRHAIFLATPHLAPPHIYEKLQKEIDSAHANGYLIFSEELQYGRRPRSRNARAIYAYLQTIFQHQVRKVRNFGSEKNYGDQFSELRYPPGTIFADTTARKIAERADAQGIAIDRSYALLLHLWIAFNAAKNQEAGLSTWWRYPMKLAAKASFYFLGPRLSEWTFKDQFLIYFEKLEPLLLGHRNKIAFRMIRRAARKNFCAIYGGAHIPGLIALFEADGWKTIGSEPLGSFSI